MNYDSPAAPTPSATAYARAFAFTSLDAFRIALEALIRGEAIARKLPRGYAPLRDQLSRALQSAYLQTCEGAARGGADRRARLGSARAEAGEAAAALVAIAELSLGDRAEIEAVIELLGRLCATLVGLGRKTG
jgi:four helix bundle protein